MCFILCPAVIGSASPLRLSLSQYLLPSGDLHLPIFYQTFPEGHPDVVLTASAEHCHFMNSLKDTFLWVMSPQPSDSSRVAASKCWEEPLVPQGGTHGPKPRASSRRDSPGGKGGRLPVWTEGQLTSLTSGWRTWRAQDCGSLCRALASFLRVCVTHRQARR